MIRNNFINDRPFLEAHYVNDPFSQDTGISPCDLNEHCKEIERSLKGQSRLKIKSDIIAFILKNARISAAAYDIFPNRLDHGDILNKMRNAWKRELDITLMASTLEQHKAAQDGLLYTGDLDYSHTSPDWSAILSLGLPGLIERLRNYSQRPGLSESQSLYYTSLLNVYDALKFYLLRLADESERQKDGIDGDDICAITLRKLTKHAPSTLYEAMMLTVIFYYTQNYLDCSYVRSLGALDTLYYPFYRSDIESGKYSKDELIELFKYFFVKFYAFKNPNNIPFYICGTDKNGNAIANELSYLILDVYDSLNIPDPKIQIRCNAKTPEDILKKAAKMISQGNNSIVFLNDEIIIKSLMGIGQSFEEASDYAPIGCYEPTANKCELSCTCSGKINLGKVIQNALLDGNSAPSSFDEFYESFKATLQSAIKGCVCLINQFEKYYPITNPSPIFSGTFLSSVESARDIYDGGVKYPNTSIDVFGLATAVDSLLAVKHLVYTEKLVSLPQLKNILISDWNGHAKLQLKCKNNYPKYGCANPEADTIAKEIMSFSAALINNQPNGRGGVYRMGAFSINWIYEYGEKTLATPDGRISGQPISKNLSPTLGADINGVTGAIKTAATIDHTQIPNGAVLDITLHRSAISGQDGITALFGLLKTYFLNGGGAIQFNVLDPSVLRAAQQNPEQYKNLQIRLCGWNVYFVDLSKKEQDEFIFMSESSEC